jgi:TPR repeat protein
VRGDAARDALSEFVLQSAAELGHATAQFDVGVRYERGNGVPADPEEALRWYRKPAAQGDLFATQRLALGRLWY